MRALPVVAVAAGLEVMTAGLLIVAPGAFARLLLGADLSDAGGALGRLAGISLLALALACWPRGAAPRQAAQPVMALLVFSLLCALFLAYLGMSGGARGALLWPAAAVHLVMAGLLLRSWKEAGPASPPITSGRP